MQNTPILSPGEPGPPTDPFGPRFVTCSNSRRQDGEGEAGELRAVGTACREDSGGQRASWTDLNSQSQEQGSQHPEPHPGGGGTWAIHLPS